MFSLDMKDIFLILNFYFILVKWAKHKKTKRAKDIFLNLNFYVMLVNFAKHTNKVVRRATKYATCKNVCMFFSAPDASENLLIRMKFAGV